MILVVGGAGYIGSHTVKQLVKEDYQVVVYDNLYSGHQEYIKWGVPFVFGDLANKEQLRKLFSNYPIEAVVHFAAHAYVGESVTDPHKYYVNNVTNTLNLLEVMLEHTVKNIVFSSTCATYGIPEEIPITEAHKQQPINPYGRTKLVIEQILADYEKAYGLKYVALRYFNAAGADLDNEIGEWHEPETHLIPLILDVALGRRENVAIFGTDYETEDGTCIRDYIHVADLADAHIRALQYFNREQKSNVFNLGNGAGYSVQQVIATVEQVTGQKINIVKGARREGDPAMLVGSSEKARQFLGWVPEHDLQKIIETAWNWHKKLWG